MHRLVFSILLIQILAISCNQDLLKFWAYTCQLSECEEAFSHCTSIGCLGEDQCKRCVTNFNEKCTRCVTQLFDPEELYNGNLLCDNDQSLQREACKLYCRSKFIANGYCSLVNDIPICVCGSSYPTTTKPTTSLQPTTTEKQILPKSCYEVKAFEDGIYIIEIDGKPVEVYCEMKKGGWTRIMNKIDRTVAFSKNREQFIKGFGDILGNHWLGLENMHKLTTSQKFILRMELYNNVNSIDFIEYSTFIIKSESQSYGIQLSGKIAGNLYDNSGDISNGKFGTFDADVYNYPRGCANTFLGGWWFNACYSFCLTCQNEIAGQYCNGQCRNNSEYTYYTFIKMLIKPAFALIKE